ncbi:hypothetical protein M9H77_12738 [Catharanthus roseus]|uniref:Uncharacterized protein n=1 Tax=Catharanthus roseus TaxID=4058 RepID=A0ACC0BID2_CATRO|nr:hypothetical protein M9H77_12738 [Catharanthus roseus]
MNLNETLRSLQQSVERLARQCKSIARDVQELKRGKSNATMEQRVGDHKLEVEEGQDKVEEDIIDHMKRFQDMKHSVRIICLTNLERILKLAKYTMVATMIENQKKRIDLSKTNLPSSRIVVPKPQASTYKSWRKKEDTPRVAFKDHSKPKVEEKRKVDHQSNKAFASRAFVIPTPTTDVFNQGFNGYFKLLSYSTLITNPIRCFICNCLGHIAINCPTKRTSIFCECLNGWIEKDDEESLENIVDDGNSHEDGAIGNASLDAEENASILVTIKPVGTGLPSVVGYSSSRTYPLSPPICSLK